MAKPIMQFKNIAQAKRYLREWQRRLFLEDWTIDLRLVKPKEIDGFTGRSYLVFALQSVVIKIAKPNKDNESRIVKFCAEETLIHELLHCKYNILEKDNTYESTYLDSRQHQLLEQMAKSLIMAKYNLPFKWFSNI